MQGIKLELFIFDTFPLAERVALLEVHRHEEFAPVKNAPGSASDSPDTARQAILKLHTKCVSTQTGADLSAAYPSMPSTVINIVVESLPYTDDLATQVLHPEPDIWH